MAETTILFADNDPDFLETRAEFLEQEGYRIVPATDPTETRRKLEVGGIDLAIVDIRLMDDDDEKDTSGLMLAKEVAHSVPKIILTGFPSVDAVREALRPSLDGLPAAVEFVSKQEGPESLVMAVKRTLSPLESRQGYARETEGQEQIQVRTRMWASVAALVSLLLGAGAGVWAIVTGDPRWLLATIFFAIVMIVGIGLGVFME